jgi:hypothetical protein
MRWRKRGELNFTGSPADLIACNRQSATKSPLRGSPIIGILISMIQFHVWGVPISLGNGGGLLSGLFSGWLRSVHSKIVALPLRASNFLRDFGLVDFFGTVGTFAGPQGIVAIKKSELTLFFRGTGVTLVPHATANILLPLLDPSSCPHLLLLTRSHRSALRTGLSRHRGFALENADFEMF